MARNISITQSEGSSQRVFSGLKPDQQYIYNATLLGIASPCCTVSGIFTLRLDPSKGEAIVYIY